MLCAEVRAVGTADLSPGPCGLGMPADWDWEWDNVPSLPDLSPGLPGRPATLYPVTHFNYLSSSNVWERAAFYLILHMQTYAHDARWAQRGCPGLSGAGLAVGTIETATYRNHLLHYFLSVKYFHLESPIFEDFQMEILYKKSIHQPTRVSRAGEMLVTQLMLKELCRHYTDFIWTLHTNYSFSCSGYKKDNFLLSQMMHEQTWETLTPFCYSSAFCQLISSQGRISTFEVIPNGFIVSRNPNPWHIGCWSG